MPQFKITQTALMRVVRSTIVEAENADVAVKIARGDGFEGAKWVISSAELLDPEVNPETDRELQYDKDKTPCSDTL